MTSTKTKIKCFECGSTDDLYDHHVVPQSLGGTKTIVLCGGCHGKVHQRGGIGSKALTKAALAVMKSKGLRTGTVAFGCRVADDGKTLIAYQPEQTIIAKVHELRRAGYTLRATADELNRQGFQTRRGARWQHQSIANMEKMTKRAA